MLLYLFLFEWLFQIQKGFNSFENYLSKNLKIKVERILLSLPPSPWNLARGLPAACFLSLGWSPVPSPSFPLARGPNCRPAQLSPPFPSCVLGP